jgi:putative spermidine/putrescine transport system ATP-binding protein
MSSTKPVAVRFQNVSRHFGVVKAVDDLTLDIAEGEFFALLGPSGSGKTTCLRLIAGFEQPTAGHIEIFGATAEGVPPYRRNVNTVFQDYALFPHMTVLDNVAYGLMVKGMDRTSRLHRAESALKLVALPGYGERRPGQLSGGQRQRVALARALVNEPKVLLLDEPLGALDLKLREQMQVELKTLQRSLGITFVFVTHDQGEALSMADRVAIFNEGRIVQTGRPSDVYERPNSRFVADFVGSSNLLSPEFVAKLGLKKSWASLRPEKIRIATKGKKPARTELGTKVTVESVHYQGPVTRLLTRAGNQALAVTVAGDAASAGDQLQLLWARSDVHLMERER